MARWVKSHNQMRIFKQTATPAVVDGLAVGDIWIDTNSGAILKVCTAVGPVVFATDSLDASGNFSADSFIAGYATTATAAGTTTLTVTSVQQQFFTGTTTQTVTLPVASTLVTGFSFIIVNNSTGAVTVNSSGGNAVVVMAAATRAIITCILASGTDAASWDYTYTTNASGITGTGSLVRATTPTLTTPIIGAATGTSLSTSGGVSAVDGFIAGSASGGSAGSISLNSPTASRGYMALAMADNAANYTISITNASYGQSSTLTIPDVGVATGKFIMSTGAGQTIGNGLTLTTPVIGAASATSVAFSSTSGIIGTTTNDAAAAGSVGEYKVASVLIASAISLTTNTEADVTSLSLTAGDWDVWGSVIYVPTSTTVFARVISWINNSAATFPAGDLANRVILQGFPSATWGANPNTGYAIPSQRFSLSGTASVYLSAFATFSVSTCTAYGYIHARRVR